MVDIGPISFYLSLKVGRDRINQIIKFSQPTYIDKIFARFRLDKTNAINTLIKKMSLLQAKIDGKATMVVKESYQDIIGSIIFSIVETWPDIVFNTLVTSCFAKNSGNKHIKVVKTILQYLKDSRK